MAESGSGSGGARRSKSGGGSRSSRSSSSGGRSSSSSGNRSSSSRARSSSSSSSSSSSGRKQSTPARRRAAAKGGRARGRQQAAARQARETGAAAASAAETFDFSGKSAAELRDAITRGVITPLNLVMLTRERIEEVVDDAVTRGRVTAEDAQAIVQGLVARGREQTDTVLNDLETLLTRGREAPRMIGDATSKAAKRALDAADPVIAQADRARRVAGVGPSFPILGYDDLTAAQVQSRLGDLSSAELRKVRDYERRHANRKSVLDAIASQLG